MSQPTHSQAFSHSPIPLIHKHFPTHQYHSFKSTFPLTKNKNILNYKVIIILQSYHSEDSLIIFLFNLHLLLTSILYIYSGYILTENIWKEMESDLDGRESKEESEVHLEGMTNGRLDFY